MRMRSSYTFLRVMQLVVPLPLFMCIIRYHTSSFFFFFFFSDKVVNIRFELAVCGLEFKNKAVWEENDYQVCLHSIKRTNLS